MTKSPAQARWFQCKLRDVFAATFWIGIACGPGLLAIRGLQGEPVAPIWGFVSVFSLLCAFWSLRGRYWDVLGTCAFAALFFLLMLWLRKEAILG